MLFGNREMAMGSKTGYGTIPAGHKLPTQAHHQEAGIQWCMMKIEKR
jgi:hypothetical protein